MEKSRIAVCFVCLGNICRSPTAEAIFADRVARAGLEARFHLDSAGTGDWHAGETAHPPSIAAAHKRGIAITHRARVITPADFERFDHLLVMDRSNRTNVLRLARSDAERSKVRLFRSFDPEGHEEAEVPDPYYTGGYEEVLDICERTADALLVSLTGGGRAR